MEQTEFSETSAYKIQTPGNYPEENIQHTEHGESLKSRIVLYVLDNRDFDFREGQELFRKFESSGLCYFDR
jgi:hypothetical protein